MTTMDIFSLVLMGLASALCIALIFFIIKLSRTFQNVDTGLKEITSQFRPVAVALTDLSEKLSDIADEIEEPLNASVNIFLMLKQRIDLVLQVEEKIRDTVITEVSAVFNGIKSFADVYQGNGHLPKIRSIFKS